MWVFCFISLINCSPICLGYQFYICILFLANHNMPQPCHQLSILIFILKSVYRLYLNLAISPFYCLVKDKLLLFVFLNECLCNHFENYFHMISFAFCYCHTEVYKYGLARHMRYLCFCDVFERLLWTYSVTGMLWYLFYQFQKPEDGCLNTRNVGTSCK